jgi:glycosyltransferase involved in cell wall biosynthesis
VPRIVLVNRYFHPDHSATSQMASDLAFALARVGADVAVVAGRQTYEDPDALLPAHQTVDGVAIRRVGGTRFGRGRLIGRAFDYASFAVGAGWVLARTTRRGDTIIAKTDPPLLSVLAAVVAVVRGARLVNWLQDLFPEVAAALGVRLGGGVPGRLLRGARDWSLRRATINVVIGERMAARLVARGIAPECIRTIPNWADGRLIVPRPVADHPLRAAWGLDGKFVVGYSGNLGRAHDGATLAAAARLLAGDPGVVLLFVGGGAGRAAVERAAADGTGVPILTRPYVARVDLGLGLTVPDAHLVTLRPELEGLIVPSKIYGAMAAGRPIVFVGDTDGEVARLVRAHDCGIVVGAGDVQGLASAIRALRADPARCAALGANARAAFERCFDRPIAIAAWRAVLDA